ncbi:MAG: ABC transporter substrate-binding protein [Solirubrobacteraceae bacterium]|nr:ABC transporter substrate-binding protein [Solirubrobacteraceae bacterium]
MSRLRLVPLIALLTVFVAVVPAQAAYKRVAAITPFTANTLAELGVKPVARGELLGGRDQVNPLLNGVKVLKLSHPNGPNLEQLAQVNPQLVLTTPTFRKGAAGMRSLGMKVVESDPTSVAAVPREYVRIGGLVGKRKQARTEANRQVKRINFVMKKAKRHPTVLLILGVGRTPFAFLTNSWGGDLVRHAGGRLLTKGLKGSGGFARISNEIVVKRNPDIIIAVPHSETKNIPAMAKFLKTNPAWKNTKAMRSGRVYVSTGNSFLQPWTDVHRLIADVQTKYLKNR